MKLTYEPKNPTPVSEENIILNGKVIGEMALADNKQYRAMIRIPTSKYTDYLAFGFAEIPGDAIAAALDDAEKSANLILAEVARLRAELGGE